MNEKVNRRDIPGPEPSESRLPWLREGTARMRTAQQWVTANLPSLTGAQRQAGDIAGMENCDYDGAHRRCVK